MDASKNLKDLVIEQNIRIHAKEAPIYEIIHPQVFNWYHNRKSWQDLRYIFSLFTCESKIQVLDLGCGTGFLTLKIMSFAQAQVIALDLSKEMLDCLEAKVDSACKKRLSVINSEALAFLHNNNIQYDMITASAFFHHLVDLKEFIDCVLGHLRKRGILYLAYEPLKQPIKNKVRFILHRLIRRLDEFVFRARMKSLKINIGDCHQKSIADYQTTLGGINPLEIISYLKDKGSILKFDKFAVRANGFLAFISDKLIRSENTFSIIFQKA